MITISLLRETTLLNDNDVSAAVSALQTQVHAHFAEPWGIDAIIRFVAGPPPRGSWWIVLVDDPEQADTLGYHDLTDEGLPIGKAFVKTTQEAQGNWTVTISHEVLEMLVDPGINLSVLRDEDNGKPVRLFSYEICDPCEADEFGYKIDNILVSDFVYPSWFESFHSPRSVQFDYCGRIREPFQLLPGGYANVRAINEPGGWTQIEADSGLHRRMLAGEYKGRKACRGSRRLRRQKPCSNWKRSILQGPRSSTTRIFQPSHSPLHAAGIFKQLLPDPAIVTLTSETKSVPDEIQKAIDAVKTATPGSLPDADSTRRALQNAIDQIERKDRDASLNGAIPDDLQISLVLSSINRSAGKSHQVRAMDLLGAEQYEKLDPGWLGSLYNRLKSQRFPFPTHVARNLDPRVHTENYIRIAIAGDWGTGNCSSKRIAQRILDIKPDHTLHLGDVYYSGTDDEEQDKFIGRWPAGVSATAPSFALNGNHEMYSGGDGYFLHVLMNSQFRSQQGLSYFLLENDHWAIFGLDSAYHAQDFLYQNGNLDQMQLSWLRETAGASRVAGKRIILLTHHHGIDLDVDKRSLTYQQPIWDQIVSVLEGGPDYWYWGHVHAGIAYLPLRVQGRVVRTRCVGHGGVPYAPFPADLTAVGVEWAESDKANDPDEERRALNGFVLLTLDGATLSEQFYDENGSIRKVLTS